jgi:hypothetical protein
LIISMTRLVGEVGRPVACVVTRATGSGTGEEQAAVDAITNERLAERDFAIARCEQFSGSEQRDAGAQCSVQAMWQAVRSFRL